MTLLDTITAAVWGDAPGDELAILREDAEQVILNARGSLNRPDTENSVGVNVPRVEAVITRLLPYCQAHLDPAGANTTARSVVEHAHDLIGGAHPSQSYSARQRLRILLYSVRRLLALTRAGPVGDTPGTSP
jgi:hypothetical protein